MNDAPTDVIESEAASTAESRIKRAPLVLNKRNFSWITERISGVVEQPAPQWLWDCFIITVSIAMLGFFCLGYQVSTGVSTSGLNHLCSWAWDITKFVSMSGIGHC